MPSSVQSAKQLKTFNFMADTLTVGLRKIDAVPRHNLRDRTTEARRSLGLNPVAALGIQDPQAVGSQSPPSM
jgi:hypothetical protein